MIYYWNAGRKFIWMAFGCLMLIAVADCFTFQLSENCRLIYLIIVIITVFCDFRLPYLI